MGDSAGEIEDDALLAAVPAVSFELSLGPATQAGPSAGDAQTPRIDESAVPATHDGVMNDDGSSGSPLPTRQLTAFEMRNAEGAFVGICGTTESPTVVGSVSADGLPNIPISLGQVIAFSVRCESECLTSHVGCGVRPLASRATSRHARAGLVLRAMRLIAQKGTPLTRSYSPRPARPARALFALFRVAILWASSFRSARCTTEYLCPRRRRSRVPLACLGASPLLLRWLSGALSMRMTRGCSSARQ